MRLSARIAKHLLALIGWRLVYEPPPGPKAVLIVYPHTSNWDFFVGFIARTAAAFPVHWAAKDTLFRPPIAWLLRRLGGIPVNRRIRTGFVAQMTEEFARRDQLYLVIAPEGTRSHVSRWKSGFYHLARNTGVPLGIVFIDYARREVGVLGYFELSGDVRADMDRIRSFYAGRQAREPALAGPAVLAEEMEPVGGERGTPD
jgi:1-acyl-sn-glycerol-3-phosphate acyltransferase